jgi:hypothetical protein
MAPVRASFFYPWYPGSWYPQTHYKPVLGAPYASDDDAVIAYQIAGMQYAHTHAGISSWWGQGSPTDTIVPQLLSAATGTGFTWCLYYEPAPGTQASDLSYIYANYAASPNYLRVGGKPVLFVYGRSAASCADSAAWVAANAGRFYLSLQVFGGYAACPAQPDSWHQYGPAVRADHQPGYSYTISPGYWKYSDASPTLARSVPAFTTAAQAMVASGEPWQLVTTWNEWGEGSSVEDATAWQSGSGFGAYADALHATLPA